MSLVADFQPDWVSPPGETIAAILAKRGLTLEDFAEQMDQSVEDANELIIGRGRITTDIAQRLAEAVGASSSFWLNREAQYRGDIDRLEDASDKGAERDWLAEIPFADMARLGWIKKATKPADKVEACLKFFGVSNIRAWRESYSPVLQVAAFRTSEAFESKHGAVAAWLRQGELEAASTACRPWDPIGFRNALPSIRRLTRKKEPSQFLPELQSICAEYGVAFCVVRAPDGCRASGATRFVSSEKAMLLLSFRYRSDDHFWFTFFHEAGHLLLHGDRALFIEGRGMISTHEEDEANEFAAEVLVPSAERREMMELGNNYKEVMRFARKVGVSAGIVVGQMQHFGLLRREQMNYLKVRYTWVAD